MNNEEKKRLLRVAQAICPAGGRFTGDLIREIGARISEIDEACAGWVHQVISHPRFRKLEGSFLNLRLLVDAAEKTADAGSLRQGRATVFLLDVSASEIRDDLDGPVYQRSDLYKALYTKRYDMLVSRESLGIRGVTEIFPLAMLILDFELDLNGSESGNVGIPTLIQLSKIARDTFCPLVLGASPRLFGLRSFRELSDVQDLKQVFDQPAYALWNNFRLDECSRMVAIALPRVLARSPYKDQFLPQAGFVFSEISGQNSSADFVWGNAAHIVGSLFIRAYLETGWFVDVAGVDRDTSQIQPGEFSRVTDSLNGMLHGIATGLPVPEFSTEARGIARYSPAETLISEFDESVLSGLGFISLYSCRHAGLVSILACPSVQKSVEMSSQQATNNARLSTMFNYMVCVCRMAHLLKIQCISKIGGTAKPSELLEQEIRSWLYQFAGSGHDSRERMEKPFAVDGTSVEIAEDITNPGSFNCRVRLCPHHQYQFSNLKLDLSPIELNLDVRSGSK